VTVSHVHPESARRQQDGAFLPQLVVLSPNPSEFGFEFVDPLLQSHVGCTFPHISQAWVGLYTTEETGTVRIGSRWYTSLRQYRHRPSVRTSMS
jgi:hypothetical protein